MSTILVADDERNIRRSLQTTFSLEGYTVETVSDGEQAVAVVERGGIDLLFLDWQMPNLDGLSTLKKLRESGHELPVVFLSAYGTIERAVEADAVGRVRFRREAAPRRTTPDGGQECALRQVALIEENLELRGEAAERYDMIGDSPPMVELYEQIRRTAPTQARVLILGENGSGKELIARALHAHSPTGRRTVRPGQLRRGAARSFRVGVVRPREGRVHRGDRAPARQVRPRRWWDVVPR